MHTTVELLHVEVRELVGVGSLLEIGPSSAGLVTSFLTVGSHLVGPYLG